MQKIIFSFVFLLSLIGSVRANDIPLDWAGQVHEVRLQNGMKFLLYQRGEAPIFSAYIRFRAGGMDEEPGKTGLAHFLEHMAFKGTKTLGTNNYEKEKPILDEIEQVGEQLSAEYSKGEKADTSVIQALRGKLKSLHEQEEKYIVKEEVAKKMSEMGGTDYNATTSKDMTSYFVSLPSENLRFWAEQESQRIFEPVFREFYEEKDVVLEERRMRVDDDPDGKLYEDLLKTAYQQSPYRWPTIGSQEDLLRLTRRDLEEFWKKLYHPSNAVGVLVGKIDLKEAEKILRETFGKINFPGEFPQKATYPAEPAQTSERRVVLNQKSRPRLVIGYHKPTLPDPDDYLFDLMDKILGDGRSSRLYKSLVIDKKLAANVESWTGAPGSRLPNLFVIQVTPLEGHSLDEIIAAIDQEIDKIKKDGIQPQELEKAKNRLMVNILWELKTNEGMASNLSYYEIVAGSWKYLADYLKQMEKFQPEDLKKLANRYLNSTNRTIASVSGDQK